MKKKVLSLLLAVCFLVGMLPVAASAAGSAFVDVPSTHWAYHHVQRAAEKGWISGMGGGRYAPDQRVTGAEFVTMIMKSLYYDEVSPGSEGEPWYQPYVDYAIENGIIRSGDFANYNAAISRADMAYIFANALPASALPAINGVASLPDVTVFTPHADEIFLLYNAGVLTGNDSFGTFKPNDTISRAEAAAIISRVAIAEERREVTLLKDVTLGDSIVLALPQDVTNLSDSTAITYMGSTAGATIVSLDDSTFQGVSITTLSTEMLNSIISDTFSSSGMPIMGISSAQVTFGAINAYRTTGILSYQGYQADCVLYIYISGSTLNMIALLSLDDDDTLLTNMANNVRVASSSVSPKLS